MLFKRFHFFFFFNKNTPFLILGDVFKFLVQLFLELSLNYKNVYEIMKI